VYLEKCRYGYSEKKKETIVGKSGKHLMTINYNTIAITIMISKIIIFA